MSNPTGNALAAAGALTANQEQTSRQQDNAAETAKNATKTLLKRHLRNFSAQISEQKSGSAHHS